VFNKTFGLFLSTIHRKGSPSHFSQIESPPHLDARIGALQITNLGVLLDPQV
jgi:hypothetical protein